MPAQRPGADAGHKLDPAPAAALGQKRRYLRHDGIHPLSWPVPRRRQPCGAGISFRRCRTDGPRPCGGDELGRPEFFGHGTREKLLFDHPPRYQRQRPALRQPLPQPERRQGDRHTRSAAARGQIAETDRHARLRPDGFFRGACRHCATHHGGCQPGRRPARRSGTRFEAIRPAGDTWTFPAFGGRRERDEHRRAIAYRHCRQRFRDGPADRPGRHRKGGVAGAVALRLAVQDADFGNIVRKLGLAGPLPAARGSLDLALDVDRPLEPEAWRNAKGTLRFRADRGSFSGVNIAGIRQLAAQKPYFPLSDAGTGSLEFDHIDISASLADGSADIREGKITGAAETLTLSGVIPYINNSLALSAIVETIPQGTDTEPLMVFIGGSWPNPVIWPVSQTPAKPLQ
ncbi:AsmA-like C-terminal region-containing protein [Neorhizobium galegae]|nr:AsmA-like C-terminal region-containing protein [Neorhizobium galegae]